MAAQKKQKSELIAIYRLEFYKKQNNWKLSGDARKQKELQKSRPAAPVKNTNILNKTYSIETNVDDEVSKLNDAFLKDESDKDTQVSPTIHTSLQTQSLEPIQACQECHQADSMPQNPWADYVDDGWVGGCVVDRCSGDGNDFNGFDGWTESMVWTNSAIPQPVWTGDAAAPVTPLPGAECPGLLWAADPVQYHQLTPWPDDQSWEPEIWRGEDLFEESLESVDEFMIGAHSVPHSSEVELCAPAVVDGEEASARGCSAARLSGAALSAAVRRHTGSLRRLLREAGRRRRHRSTLSLDVCAPDHFGLASRDFFSTEYSFDEYPTRDLPSEPLTSIYPCEDKLIQLPSANICKDRLTPQPATNLCKDGVTPLYVKNSSGDGFIPAKNFCNVGLAQLPPMNQFEDGCTLMSSSNQFSNACTLFSPANLYRDGFLAGSYRNKLPLGCVGRGRGRLQDYTGVET